MSGFADGPKGGDVPEEPAWPESHSEQTDILPVIPAQPRHGRPADTPRTAAEPGEQESPERTGDPRLRRAGLVAGAVFGLLAMLYGIDLLITQGDVPRGVTVAGVDVGGVDRTSAEQQLRDELQPRLSKPVPVRAGDVSEGLDPVAAGLSLNWRSTLDQAGAQPLNPLTRLTSFFTSREVGVVSSEGDGKLTAALERLRSKVDRDPAEGTVTFDGATPKPVDPRPGQKLDVPAATTQVLAHWASGQPLELPVTVAPVRTTREAVQAALTGIAQPAVSGPVLVRGQGKDATLSPEAIAGALSFTPAENGSLAPKIDKDKVIKDAGKQLASTEKEGKDAQIVFRGGKPSVEPSVDGNKVNWDPTLAPLLEVLKRADKREVVAKYEAKPAKVTTDEANKLGIKEVIGEFTTGGFAKDSGKNIQVVAEKVDGAIVKPGETFSLNEFTGPRGSAQGYVEAGVIENGAPAREVGGGISQFATTLYNAAYFSAMKDAGHREHSYYISRYPAAREATVFQNPDGSSVIDLKFTNDSATGVAIQTVWTPSNITVKLWGTKRYEVESVPGERSGSIPQPTKAGPADNCHAGPGAPGFTTSDTRVISEGGREIRRDTRTVRYNPQPKITCD